MFKRLAGFVAMVALTALLLAGCGAANNTSNNNTNGTNQAASNEQPYQTQGVTHEGNKVTVSMDLDSFKLIPDKVVVRKGDVVTFNVKNIAKGVPHDVVVPDFGDNAKSKILQPNETQTFTFTADKTGSFKMLCDIPGHEESGMVGKFIVVQ